MRNSTKNPAHKILTKAVSAAAMAAMVLALPIGAASAATPDDSNAPSTAVETPSSGLALTKPIGPIEPVPVKPATVLVGIDCESDSPATAFITNHLNDDIKIILVAGDFVLGATVPDQRAFTVPLVEDEPTIVTVKVTGHGEVYNSTVTLDCKRRLTLDRGITQTLRPNPGNTTKPGDNTDPADPGTDDPTDTGSTPDPQPGSNSNEPAQQNPAPASPNDPATNDSTTSSLVPTDDSVTEQAAADDITVGTISSDDAGRNLGTLLIVLVIAAIAVAGAIGATAARVRS